MVKSNFVQVEDVKTHYLESGSGEDMILLHGGLPGVPTSCEDWEFNIDPLSKHFHVYSLDQRGFGLTDVPPTDCTHTARIKHVVQFMDTVGIKSAHLVGHSMGAYISEVIALDQPEKVKRLIIIATGSGAPLGVYDEYGKLAPALARSHSFDPSRARESAREILKGGIYNNELVTDSWIDRWSKRYLNYPSLNEESRKQMPFPPPPLIDRPSQIKNPTLIIWGRQDESSFVSRGLKLFELIPGAQMHIFDKAGHFVFVDQTKAFNRLLITFCGGE